MLQEKEGQIHRILSIYDRLKNGEQIVKKEEAIRFQVSEKSIQRDIESIRAFLETEKTSEFVDYNRSKNAYLLETMHPSWLTNEEIFAIAKVLIESRAFPKDVMNSIVTKLIQHIRKDDQTVTKQMLANERHLYVELNHQKNLLDTLWQLALAIHKKKVIRMKYKREFDEQANVRTVKPVGLIFSEYYFYLIAYLENTDFDFPTIYRVDRIEHYEQTEISFKVPYHERFQEGEFRKRVQFMYTDELLNVKFKFNGPSPQAVLDRLPTAKIVKELDDGLIFEAEVFGKGVKMWLLSQGEGVEVLEPKEFREELMEAINEMVKNYDRNLANH